ncbi:MAG TPA: NlpC/P60 family protein [Spongiibacteraceae bacterium]
MGKTRIALAGLIIFAAILSGCGSHTTLPNAPVEQPPNNLSNPRWVKEILYEQYGAWKAVKYKSGGLSKAGVDCSGLVYLTYDSRFSIKLPRSTDEQIHAGTEIPQRDLVPGDLVFFITGKMRKTGKSIRHVGIYIEDRKFLHASTEKGVMISSLDDQYWNRTYWKAVRVKPGAPQFSLAH